MTILELGTVLLGLIVGYWLVSVLLDWMAARRRGDSWQSDPTSRDTASGPGSPATEPDRNNPANWPQLLEVPESASVEQISVAYRKKIAEYHPDKVARMGAEIRELAELRSKQINAAYDFAMNLRHGQGV